MSEHNTDTEWCPDLDFQDYIGELKVDSSLRHSNSGNYTTLTYRYVVEGTFAERLELADFPLDHQQLHVRATIWNAPVKWTYGDDKGNNTVTRDYEKAIKFYRGTSCVYQVRACGRH